MSIYTYTGVGVIGGNNSTSFTLGDFAHGDATLAKVEQESTSTIPRVSWAGSSVHVASSTNTVVDGLGMANIWHWTMEDILLWQCLKPQQLGMMEIHLFESLPASSGASMLCKKYPCNPTTWISSLETAVRCLGSALLMVWVSVNRRHSGKQAQEGLRTCILALLLYDLILDRAQTPFKKKTNNSFLIFNQVLQPKPSHRFF